MTKEQIVKSLEGRKPGEQLSSVLVRAIRLDMKETIPSLSKKMGFPIENSPLSRWERGNRRCVGAASELFILLWKNHHREIELAQNQIPMVPATGGILANWLSIQESPNEKVAFEIAERWEKLICEIESYLERSKEKGLLKVTDRYVDFDSMQSTPVLCLRTLKIATEVGDFLIRPYIYLAAKSDFHHCHVSASLSRSGQRRTIAIFNKSEGYWCSHRGGEGENTSYAKGRLRFSREFNEEEFFFHFTASYAQKIS